MVNIPPVDGEIGDGLLNGIGLASLLEYPSKWFSQYPPVI